MRGARERMLRLISRVASAARGICKVHVSFGAQDIPVGGILLSKDMLARIVATTIAVIGFALLLAFEKAHPDHIQAGFPTELPANRR